MYIHMLFTFISYFGLTVYILSNINISKNNLIICLNEEAKVLISKFIKMASFENNSSTPIKINYTGGPHGLGDPDDRSLRKVEYEVLIPQIMRDRAKAEKCVEEVKNFESCCKDHSLLMVIKCRKENDLLRSCLTKWYQDEEFKNECKEIYLKDRSEYRRTGLPKKIRKAASEKQQNN